MDYKKLLQGVEDMIEALENDSLHSGARVRSNASVLVDLHALAAIYKSKIPVMTAKVKPGPKPKAK